MTSGIPIRPSQFITRDGPGSLVPTVGGSILIPKLSILVNYLLDRSKGKDSFNEPNADGKTDLNKFVIDDSRMERMLRYFNSHKKPFESKIKVFSLPTNADLRVQETQNIMEGYVFPRWGICTQHRGQVAHPASTTGGCRSRWTWRPRWARETPASPAAPAARGLRGRPSRTTPARRPGRERPEWRARAWK